MKWSVGIQADCDWVLSREEVVELADAVAGYGGIATGIGTSRYGAQLIVEAPSREAAIESVWMTQDASEIESFTEFARKLVGAIEEYSRRGNRDADAMENSAEE